MKFDDFHDVLDWSRTAFELIKIKVLVGLYLV